jgi:hypothetical protein
MKHGRGGYAGARWDTVFDIRRWTAGLKPEPRIKVRYGIFLPGGSRLSQVTERLLPHRVPGGSFLAVAVLRAD